MDGIKQSKCITYEIFAKSENEINTLYEFCVTAVNLIWCHGGIVMLYKPYNITTTEKIYFGFIVV